MNKALAVLEFRKKLYREKILECTKQRNEMYNGRVYQKQERVYIQRHDKNRWTEAEVVDHSGSKVWVEHNGQLICVNEMRVMPLDQ